MKLAMLGLVLCAACTKPTPPPADPGGPIHATRVQGQAAQMDTVVMLSQAVAGSIGVTSTAGRRGAVGTLECLARLVNRTGGPLVVQARATYYDASSLPIDDATAFQTVKLPARGEAGVQFQSTSTTAAHYVIEIGELQ